MFGPLVSGKYWHRPVFFTFVLVQKQGVAYTRKHFYTCPIGPGSFENLGAAYTRVRLKHEQIL